MQWDGSQQLSKGLSDSDSRVNQLYTAHIHTPTHTQSLEHAAHFQVSHTSPSVRVHALTSAGAPWGVMRTEPGDCCRSGDTLWGLHSMLQQKQMLLVEV